MVLDHSGHRLAVYDCGFGGQDVAITLKGYFKNANIAILVYDRTLLDSFEGVKHWYSQIKTNTDECPGCRFLVVGTRADTDHVEVSKGAVDR